MKLITLQLLLTVAFLAISGCSDKPKIPKGPVGSQNSIGMSFAKIQPGTFERKRRLAAEGEPKYQVTITKGFELSICEVTQSQFEKLMDKNPSSFKNPDRPVERVTWGDAVKFCEKLSELPAEKKAGYIYRLPTDAEWEYACRAGTNTQFSFGDIGPVMKEYGWYSDNAESETQVVGQKKPNPWGLYDMHGNVWEWCQDWYAEFPRKPATDPTGPKSGKDRVVRGGSYNYASKDCTSSSRKPFNPVDRLKNVGFRVVRVQGK